MVSSSSQQPQPTYKLTPLWARLQKLGSSSDHVRRVVESCLDKAEKVLHSAGTSALNFTLHDEEHSFRVARRMPELIREEVFHKLGADELGLLLLSAYLHDIGMSPARDKVRQHTNYLVTGEAPALSLEEKERFREWLDDHGYSDFAGKPLELKTAEALNSAELIITHYCRHQHNRWSEEWIRAEFKDQRWFDYVDWLDDVVRICRSHHEGYTELRTEEFDPKLVGNSSPRVVHLRFLACMLRVADVLEFDPERTPEVIFKHRSIDPSSAIFWHRDQSINFAIAPDKAAVLLTAYPPDAKIHRAIEETVASINSELGLCRRLAEESHFDVGPLGPLPHRWDLPSTITDQIRPKNDSYVYINGAFRPNTQRLLQLLSGRRLYETYFAAVRELLQNAFDATKELIAREILDLPGKRKDAPVVISSSYTVELEVQKSGTDVFLRCYDQGVGMNKRIIEDYLLVSGTGKRHEILELERRCEKAGFTLDRTGEFGIGVLSYFMLADTVQIRTRRHALCRDTDPNGWLFVTDGVGGFGELRKDLTFLQGTEVRLHLKNEFVSDLKAFEAGLRSYVLDVLCWIPCNLRLIFSDGSNFSVSAGWKKSPADIAEIVLERLVYDPHFPTPKIPADLLPKSELKRGEEAAESWQQITQDFLKRIKFHTVTGELPQRIGRYRLHIPYFELSGGSSLAYASTSQSHGSLYFGPLSGGDFFSFKSSTSESWRGIATRGRGKDSIDSIFAEIDWLSTNALRIAANREEFEKLPDALHAHEWLEARSREELLKFVKLHRSSVYASLNRVITDVPVEAVSMWCGAPEKRNAQLSWEPIKFPCTTQAYVRGAEQVIWKGKPLTVVRPMRQLITRHLIMRVAWANSCTPPDRILFRKTHGNYIVPVWESAPAKVFNQPFLVAAFPAAWAALCGVSLVSLSGESRETIWNKEHALVRNFDKPGWDKMNKVFARSRDLNFAPLSDEALGVKPNISSAWIAHVIIEDLDQLWRGLLENQPDRARDIFRAGFQGENGELLFLHGGGTTMYLTRVSLAGWKTEHVSGRDRAKVLPDPGAEWTVESHME